MALGAAYAALALAQGNAPAQLPNGPAKPGFDIGRFSSNGGLFKTFDVQQTEPLQKVLKDGRVGPPNGGTRAKGPIPTRRWAAASSARSAKRIRGAREWSWGWECGRARPTDYPMERIRERGGAFIDQLDGRKVLIYINSDTSTPAALFVDASSAKCRIARFTSVTARWCAMACCSIAVASVSQWSVRSRFSADGMVLP